MLFIKEFFKFFWKDKIMFFAFLLNILVNVIIWINLLKVQKVDGLIPLHYNIYLGIDYMGEWYKIFMLPTFGLVVLFFNLFLSSLIYFKDKFIPYILLFISLLVQIILLLASFAVVWINV